MFIDRELDNYNGINQKLIDVCGAKEKKIVNESLAVSGLSFIKLRDVLFSMGKIHFEDTSNNIYIAIIPGGFLKMNYATVVFNLLEDELIIAAYADEGLINQHTCEGVINEFRKQIEQYIRD